MAKLNLDSARANLLLAAKTSGTSAEVDLERLSAFVDGTLNESQAAEVKQLLATNNDWYRSWRQLQQAVADTRVSEPVAPPRKSKNVWFAWLGGLAASCVLVLSLYFMPSQLNTIEAELAVLVEQYPADLVAPMAMAKHPSTLEFDALSGKAAAESNSSEINDKNVGRVYRLWASFTARHCIANTETSSPVWQKLESLYRAMHENASSIKPLNTHGRRTLCDLVQVALPQINRPQKNLPSPLSSPSTEK